MAQSTPAPLSGPSVGPLVAASPGTGRLRVRVLAHAEELESLRAALGELGTHALEPNPFYEPWMLLPALGHYAKGVQHRFVLVESPRHAGANSPHDIVGFFPLEEIPRLMHLPIRALRLWHYEHCFLATPLVHRDDPVQTVATFLGWLQSSGCGLLEMRGISGEGLFSRSLFEALAQTGLLSYPIARRSRALFVPRERDIETYLRSAIRGRHVKDLRRKKKRLLEKGPFAVRSWSEAEPVAPWIARFLELERAGWKGTVQTAFASTDAGRCFFKEIVESAAEQRRLRMLALEIDNRAIAMKCNFLAGDGGFAFKIAYDEAFAQYSPGMLLEIENMRLVAGDPSIRWMDSCASPDHFMISRLWQERRAVETLLVGTGRLSGELALALLPALRIASRAWRRVRGQAGPTKEPDPD